MSAMVTCKLCEAQFPGGHGCASSFYVEDDVWYLVGHYGSRLYDMNLYRVIPPSQSPDDIRSLDDSWLPLPKVNTSPICDVCISVWQLIGRLELIRETAL